jgi:nucleosome assembly protein 1-like 1
LKTKVAAIIKPAESEADKEPEKTPLDVSYLKGKVGIPDFWVRAMKANKLIWDQVREKDEAIFEHLKHIETETKENEETKNMELTLKMTFGENEFFTNPDPLSVTLEFEAEDEVKEVRGIKIDWAEGKDPTQKKIKKKQKHKKTGETRTIVKTVDAESFFNLFKDKKVSSGGENDSDEENNMRDKIDEVQQTVEDFHDLLMPDALEYYLGLNEDFDMLGMDGDDDDDDDDEDDDDSEGEPKPKKGKKKAAGGGGDAAGGDGE